MLKHSGTFFFIFMTFYDFGFYVQSHTLPKILYFVVIGQVIGVHPTRVHLKMLWELPVVNNQNSPSTSG